MADQLNINGAAHNWNSTIFKIAGSRYTGITSITYSEKMEATLGYGMGRHHAPTRRAAGKYVPGELKIKGYKATIEAIRTQIAALSTDGKSYGVPQFTSSLQFIETGDTPISVQAVKCRIMGTDASSEENPDPTMDELTLQPMYYLTNGRTLFDASQGLP